MATERKQKMVVCPDCDGHGKYVNPAIDGGGIGAEDFANDPDFERDYFEGCYDVVCERCHGANVVPANKTGHPASGHPCEACGGDQVSTSMQEYPGATRWVDWHCYENAECEYHEPEFAHYAVNSQHPAKEPVLENKRGW